MGGWFLYYLTLKIQRESSLTCDMDLAVRMDKTLQFYKTYNICLKIHYQTTATMCSHGELLRWVSAEHMHLHPNTRG